MRKEYLCERLESSRWRIKCGGECVQVRKAVQSAQLRLSLKKELAPNSVVILSYFFRIIACQRMPVRIRRGESGSKEYIHIRVYRGRCLL